eukprot:TRINITY_DN1346_c0_g1_i1.p1 TRINITY_DN1346_c0_g1~~TRINITY_DN1346_c0_g1_i1.p1  ORF type:complete len:520 (+),score=215.35 TRINITY_DN1346_c0_g1_i1:33-1562(+)
MDSVLIVGAGLSGALLAVALKRKGFDVLMVESREDLRKDVGGVHRSINLVLTSRGRFALRSLGLEKEVMELVVPCHARCIHNMDGSVVIQPYGKDESEANYSISRSGLNKKLLDVAEREGVKILFKQRLLHADFTTRKYTLCDDANKKTVVGAHLCFGADGAASVTRRELLKHLIDVPITDLDTTLKRHWRWGGSTSIKYEVQRLGVAYKELMFPLQRDGSQPLDTRYLHIWPRGSHFLMGLANLDGSMTGTLYLPDDSAVPKSDLTFETTLGKEKGMAYMNEYYKDAVPVMPDLAKEWEENPHALLATARVSHWVFEDKVCLIGDAAHAVVPFFGQGMNASFEDVTYIMYLIGRHGLGPKGGDWKKAFQEYHNVRSPAGHAISDLAIENYTEMCKKVGETEFLQRKAVENKVEKAFPLQFRSRYYMITNTLIPYHWVDELGVHINTMLTELMTTVIWKEGEPEPDMNHARALIAQHITPYIEAHGINLANPWTFYGPREVQLQNTSKL